MLFSSRSLKEIEECQLFFFKLERIVLELGGKLIDYVNTNKVNSKVSLRIPVHDRFILNNSWYVSRISEVHKGWC